MSYLEFCDKIEKEQIKIIFELGSRDLIDAYKLLNYFNNSTVYAFECNPDCLIECNKQPKHPNLFLIDKAVSLVDDKITFYPFDLSKYNNMGSSSMLKIDFSKRDINDADYNKPNPQKEITVDGIRLDTFINKNNIPNIDLLCIDLQGYELNALISLGADLHKVKYIITECSIKSTYTNGATFKDLYNYLIKFNFVYVSSNKFGNNFPNLRAIGFSEFDAIFINKTYM